MKKWLFITCTICFFACKEHKPDLSGEAPVKVNDFVAAFKPLTLPYVIADTNLAKASDTTVISAKVLSQFIPDSVLSKYVHGDKKTIIKPIGRINKDKDRESYLLVSIAQSKKTRLIVFVLDKKNKYVTDKQLLNTADADDYIHSVSINREPTFLIIKEKLNAAKQLMYTRIGWAYNTAGVFMVVINDSNEDLKKTNTIINPIDTLPRKNKLSGEYVENKRNFISIRDGKNANTYLFFIHFEKKDGTCIGELKGDLKMKDATKGIYNQSGDPCIIDFTFEGNQITLKEQGSCGNKRGIDCLFDDTFIKKKEAKPVKKKN